MIDKTTTIRWTRRRIHLIKALVVYFLPIIRHVRSFSVISSPVANGVCTIQNKNKTIIHNILSWSDVFCVTAAYIINKIAKALCLSRISDSV